MHKFSRNDGPTAEEVRKRLRGMTDEQLPQFGRAANFMCSPGANMNRAPRRPFLIQLHEARREWKRRHDGKSEAKS
jgi:hypothetical protein